MAGDSRASKRRKKRKWNEHATAADRPQDAPRPNQGETHHTHTRLQPPHTPHDLDQQPTAQRTHQPPTAAHESRLPLEQADDGLRAALELALAQACTIHGRKYRYGATLLAGDDRIAVKSSSNKKVFQRDNIHAEMAALKGCARPEGKDMLIVRLAPTPPAANGSAASAREPKVLNARPCDRCFSRMVRKGLRTCYFTLNGLSLGVLELQSESALRVVSEAEARSESEREGTAVVHRPPDGS